MAGFVYDTGALIAAERRDPRILDLQRRGTEFGDRPLVPAVVLAQAWRGGPQAPLSRFLRGCEVVPDDETLARAAGTACAAAGTSDVVDAIVVVTAIMRRAAVATSDPADLTRLATALGATLALHVL